MKSTLLHICTCVFSLHHPIGILRCFQVSFSIKRQQKSFVSIFFKVIENRDCGGKHADRFSWQIAHFSVLSTSHWAILSDSMDQRLRTTCGYCCRCRKFGLTKDSFHNCYHSCYYSCDKILLFFKKKKFMMLLATK